MRRLSSLFAAVFTVFITTPALATIYYVDSNQAGYNGTSAPSGACATADAGAGTSIGAPWCTVQKVSGFQGSLVGDDEVLFKRGDTWTEKLTITNIAGTSGHQITLGNYGLSNSLPLFDEQGAQTACFSATSGTTKYLTIDGIECKNATQYGVTFQSTSTGSDPGIVVQNSYIHNTGPGAFATATQGPTSSTDPTCSNSPPGGPGACDDGNYRNQLDFEDFGSGLGIDSVHFLNNTVNNCGGHNCIQVHYDGGDSLVQGNTVGPGCVHNCIDVKGSGTLGSHTAQIDSNKATTFSASSTNASACYYVENIFNASSDTLITKNVCTTTAVRGGFGFQGSSGGSCSHAHCLQNLTLYNNTFASTNGQTFQSCIFVNDASLDADTTLTAKNNICEGGTVTVNAAVTLTWDYNDDGGHQGKSSAYTGVSTGTYDVVNVDPLYVNFAGANYQLTSSSPVATTGLAGTGTGLVSMGAFPAPGAAGYRNWIAAGTWNFFGTPNPINVSTGNYYFYPYAIFAPNCFGIFSTTGAPWDPNSVTTDYYVEATNASACAGGGSPNPGQGIYYPLPYPHRATGIVIWMRLNANITSATFTQRFNDCSHALTTGVFLGCIDTAAMEINTANKFQSDVSGSGSQSAPVPLNTWVQLEWCRLLGVNGSGTIPAEESAWLDQIQFINNPTAATSFSQGTNGITPADYELGAGGTMDFGPWAVYDSGSSCPSTGLSPLYMIAYQPTGNGSTIDFTPAANANWQNAAAAIPGSLSYNADAVASDLDIYNMTLGTHSNVLFISQRASVEKTAPGTRIAQLGFNISGTMYNCPFGNGFSFGGDSLPLYVGNALQNGTYQQIGCFATTDPSTGTTWSGATDAAHITATVRR